MFFADFLFALAIGLLLTVIFGAGFRRTGPWGAWWAFLLIVFLAAWVGGVWVRPIGAPLFGVNWLPLLFMGALFALLLASVVPASPPRTRAEAVVRAETEEAVAVAFGAFFWILLVGLLVAVLLGYLV
jgi:hypothetical protein